MIIKMQKIVKDAEVPIRTSDGAVGYDLHAYRILDRTTKEILGEPPACIPPGEAMLFGAGIKFAVPPGVDCQLRPRSGLASKFDIELGNSPGTLDPDFRGEAGILLRNHGKKPYTIQKGDRIVQLVFTKVELPVFVEVDKLPPTTRNTGGFGSTGLQGPGFGLEEYAAEQLKWDRYFMRLAHGAASLSNCLRGAQRGKDGEYLKDEEGRYVGATRRYGCVIAKGENIIAVGFNSRIASECSEECGCARERENIPSGVSNDRGCLHAEEMAIQKHGRTGGSSLEGTSIIVNAEPCFKCSKYILGCGVSTVIVPPGEYHTNGLSLLQDAGIEIRRVKL